MSRSCLRCREGSITSLPTPRILVKIVDHPIDKTALPSLDETGAVVEFSGIVRATENAASIAGIGYEAFVEMAEDQLLQIAVEIVDQFSLNDLTCIHRIGFVPVGECALYLRTSAKHRAAAYNANMAYIDRVKQDVPIWKQIES